MTPLEEKLTDILRANPYQSGHVANVATIEMLNEAYLEAFKTELNREDKPDTTVLQIFYRAIGREEPSMTKCVICDQPATTEYEGHSSCGRPNCEYQIQEGIDHLSDVGGA